MVQVQYLYSYDNIVFVIVQKLCYHIENRWVCIMIEYEDLKILHGLDVVEELTKILIEEINKEIKENGSVTWKEFCGQIDKKEQDGE